MDRGSAQYIKTRIIKAKLSFMKTEKAELERRKSLIVCHLIIMKEKEHTKKRPPGCKKY